MLIRPYGKEAILIEFDQLISPKIHQEVLKLYTFFKNQNIEGVRSLIPAYCSLTIVFNSSKVTIPQLKKQIESGKSELANLNRQRRIRIPLCYAPDFALDMEEVMQQTGLSASEIIALHTAQEYRVYMMGFVPGFAYLGKLDTALYCSRKKMPRQRVPSGAVAIAAFQTAVYPLSTPGGWQIIGNSPLPFLKGSIPPFSLFSIGDKVFFEAIDIEQYHQIKQLIKEDSFEWEQLYD